jgi:hypothetical protein
MKKVNILSFVINSTLAAFCIVMNCSTPNNPQNNAFIFRSMPWNDVALSGRYMELQPADSSFLFIESEFSIKAHTKDTTNTIMYWSGRYSTSKTSSHEWTFETKIDSLSACDGASRNPEYYKNYQIIRSLEGSLFDSADVLSRITGKADLGMYYKGNGGSSSSTLDLHFTNE